MDVVARMWWMLLAPRTSDVTTLWSVDVVRAEPQRHAGAGFERFLVLATAFGPARIAASGREILTYPEIQRRLETSGKVMTDPSFSDFSITLPTFRESDWMSGKLIEMSGKVIEMSGK